MKAFFDCIDELLVLEYIEWGIFVALLMTLIVMYFIDRRKS